MSIIRDLKGEKRNHPNNTSGSWSVLREMIRGQKTNSGVEVSQTRAMQLTAVYACVRILSETVANLPFPVYRRLERGKERDHNHYLYKILQEQANPYMTAFSFRETMMQHLLLWGNAFAEIQRDNGRRVVGLWPLLPNQVTIFKHDDGSVDYGYHTPDGKPNILSRDKVFHIPGMGFDGIRGYSPLKLASEAIGMGIAAEEYGARFYNSGGRPSGVLEHPHVLNDDGARRMREDWERLHDGLSNAHRVAILEQGTKYNQIGVPPNEAQFLESRKFQTEEIARFFRVPPHMLGDLDRATFSNIEQQSIDFVTHSVTPWLKRWEQSVKMQLFGGGTKRTHFAEFVLDGLLRGDTESRYNAYAQAHQNGWLSANDIREKENLNPVEGGDVYLIPVNMTPADTIYDQLEQKKKAQEQMQEQTQQQDNDDDNDEKEQEEEQNNNRSLTRAQTRALHFRENVRDSNKRILKQSIKRIFKEEQDSVMKEAKNAFEERDASDTFMDWLSDYYNEERDRIEQELRPVMQSIGSQVYASVQDELGSTTAMPRDVSGFIQQYIQQMAKRISGNSFSALMKRLEQKPDDIVNAMEAEFDDWQENRADSIAQEEAIRSSGAITVTAYSVLGVAAMRWVAESDACPYCREMDGKTVDVEQTFINAGESLEVEGEESFTPNSSVKHPPVHGGCQCQVVAD